MSLRTLLPCALLSVLLGIVSGCGDEAGGAPEPPPAPAPEPSLVDPELMADTLPASVGRWELASMHAALLDRQQPTSRVAGSYMNPDCEQGIFFELLDCLKSPALKQIFDVTYNQQAATGTFRFEAQGYPGVKVFSRSPVNADIKVMVEDRFLFQASGEVDLATMEAFLAGIDMQKIARLQ